MKREEIELLAPAGSYEGFEAAIGAGADSRSKSSSFVTVHIPLSREMFWHEYAKITRHTSQNSIAAGNLE